MTNKPEAAPADFETLIEAVAQKRDNVAFARLFENFAPRIKSFLMRSGEPAQRAEEWAQEALLTVWRKAHLFRRTGATASAWIFTIARNLRLDALRRDKRSRLPEGDPGLEPEDVPLPDRLVLTGEAEARVRTALSKLSEEQKEVVLLSFFEDAPHAEIAEKLGIPLGTVKSRLRLAMQHLRRYLDDSK